ncbi:hypothetical protein [Kibdelosporangium philippinense]|uniref:hypothetical protein n=1 Tax=Kibdelosporangium philippinense TaxID=211113 RepID=UPI003617A467
MRLSLLIVSASLGFLAACSGSPETQASTQSRVDRYWWGHFNGDAEPQALGQ